MDSCNLFRTFAVTRCDLTHIFLRLLSSTFTLLKDGLGGCSNDTRPGSPLRARFSVPYSDHSRSEFKQFW